MKNVQDAGFSRKRGRNAGSGPPFQTLAFVLRKLAIIVILSYLSLKPFFKHRILILCSIACTVKDSNPFMECSSLLEGFSLSINRDGVTGSTLSGNKVKAYIAHMNKKHPVNSMLKYNL